jgi:hypothetical protein
VARLTGGGLTDKQNNKWLTSSGDCFVNTSPELTFRISLLPYNLHTIHFDEERKDTRHRSLNTDSQNFWVYGLCPLSEILNTRRHDVSEIGSVSVLR